MNKVFMREFIQLYRSFPCLWSVKTPEYSNRRKKNKAYEQLLKKFKDGDPSATLLSLKRKIDAIRGAFRKELKKVKESVKSGAVGEDIYTPTLWYFDQLLFLTDFEIPNRGIEISIKPDHETVGETNDRDDREWSHNDTTLQSLDFVESTETTPTQRSNSKAQSLSNLARNSIITRKRARADEVLEKVQQLDEPQHLDDEYDVIGKNIANKLRRLPQDTAIVVEKLIMDVLFEGHLGNIDKGSQINIYSESDFN